METGKQSLTGIGFDRKSNGKRLGGRPADARFYVSPGRMRIRDTLVVEFLAALLVLRGQPKLQ